MKKVLKTLIMVMILAVVVTALASCEVLDTILGYLPWVECSHTGGTATCAAQAICEKCGEPYGDKLPHDPKNVVAVPASCTEAGHTAGVKCSVCDEVLEGLEEVPALGHNFYDDGCEKLCLGCGLIEGAHQWKEATCTEPKTCEVCNKTEGKAAGHTGGTATCTTKAICDTCHEEYGELAKHSEVDMDDVPASCGENGSTGGKKCSVCDTITVQPTVIPATGEHTGGTATCKDQAICDKCHLPYGDLLEHKGGTATCKDQAICDNCKQPYGELGDHTGGTADCTNKAICTVCSQPYGKLGAHNYNGENGTCSVCHAYVFDADIDLKDIAKGAKITSGTTFANGLVTLNGDAKRSNSGNFSVEITKRGASYLTFVIPEGMTANVTLNVSSTGSSNTSDFGIFDSTNTIVENEEKATTVTGSNETSFHYTLTAGTYTVVSPDGGDNSNRGVRVFEIKVVLD